MALGQASSSVLVLGSRVGVGQRIPLACIHCGVLEPDPRTLGPSGMARIPGAGAHSGSVHSLQISGSLLGVPGHSLPGHSGGSTRVMAGKWGSLGILCPHY